MPLVIDGSLRMTIGKQFPKTINKQKQAKSSSKLKKNINYSRKK